MVNQKELLPKDGYLTKFLSINSLKVSYLRF